jgi:hypothetical protein
MLMAILVVIRDALLAAALAWVGVTMETSANRSDQVCNQESCQAQRDE